MIDARLVDKLRIIVYPLIASPGNALFAATESQHKLELRRVEQHSAGWLSLMCELH